MKKILAVFSILFALFLMTNNLEANAYQIQADVTTKEFPQEQSLSLKWQIRCYPKA